MVNLNFNVNHDVQVRLTDEGRKRHREWHDELYKNMPGIEYEPPVEDILGRSEWQLWCLMQIFGPKLYNGGPQLFVNSEIVILDIDVKLESHA